MAPGVHRAGHLHLAAPVEGAHRAAGQRRIGECALDPKSDTDMSMQLMSTMRRTRRLVLGEALAFHAVGPLVLGAAEECDVPVVQLLLGDGLEIEDRQRLLRRRDRLAGGAALAERHLAERVEDRRGERDVRQGGAGGQHAQELPPVGLWGARVGHVTLLQTSGHHSTMQERRQS